VDDLAQQIGYGVIVGGFLVGWFVVGVKAAENGYEVLAWIIGLGPPVALAALLILN